MSNPSAEEIHIFVGTDRSQRLGVRALEYSIAKNTQRPFTLRSLESVQLPQPRDLRQVQRTGFSFSRFAIPQLMGFKGKALYMDADMLVFKDIGLLWDTPFNGKKMLVQADSSHSTSSSPGLLEKFRPQKQRPKQSSVSLLDCERLNWHAEEIIAGLDGKYTYSELMSDLCILSEKELGYTIPYQWNSLEYWDSSTCNIHYTDMQTQPWVYANNKHGGLWVDVLKEMLAGGALTQAEVQAEVELGYARPSLLLELDKSSAVGTGEGAHQCAEDYIEYDNQQDFIAHKAVYAAKRQREGVEQAYAAVARSAASTVSSSGAKKKSLEFSSANPLRIMYVANAANLPTLQLAFTRPLSGLVRRGLIISEVIDELMIGAHSRIRLSRKASRQAYINKLFDQQQPDLIVFCRYSGLMTEYLVQQAKQRGIKTLCALDDDLLNVPPELGEKKYAYHNDPQRKHALAYLLNHCELIYSATSALSAQLQAYAVNAPIYTAKLFCPAEIHNVHQSVNDKVFGYMGFGHECDIAVALPGIVAALEQDKELRFELFGTIPKPAELDVFGERVRIFEPDWEYSQFLAKLADRAWSVGLCPLADVPFNQFKVSTKWLEYTASGTAVVASNHPVYQDTLAGGCGLLVPTDESWQTALPEFLANNPLQKKCVQNAQQKQQLEFNTSVFEQQFFELLERLDIHQSQ